MAVRHPKLEKRDIHKIQLLINTYGGIAVEIISLHLLILFSVLYIPGFAYSFLQMNLHPLFLITFVIAIRHGFIVGLLSAATSCLVYITGYLYQGLDLALFFQSFNYYKFPLMFLATGYVSGRIHDKHVHDLKTMRDANNDLLEEYNRMEEEHRRTLFMLQEVREEIVGSEYSIFSLYQIATSLQTTSPEKVYTESIGLLHKFIRANSISIYTLEAGGYLRLKIGYGAGLKRQSSVKYMEIPTYRRLVEEKRPMRWPIDKKILTPMFSAPIIDNDSVIGIVNIDSIEFEYITEYSFSIFSVIIDWINQAMSQAIELDKKYNITGVSWSNSLTRDQFQAQELEEIERKNKYGLPYCKASYKIPRGNAEDIVFEIRKTLRSVDFVYYDSRMRTVYILLPATHPGLFSSIEQRLYSNIKETLEKLS